MRNVHSFIREGEQKMKKTGRNIFAALLLAFCTSMIVLCGTAFADTKVDLGVITNDSDKPFTGVSKEYGKIYHTFTVNRPGILIVTGVAKYLSDSKESAWRSMSVGLYSKDGKLIDRYAANTVNSDEKKYVCYGLRKGTYQICLQGYKDYMYILGVNFTATKDQGGAKKKKATPLKKKREFCDIIGAGTNAKTCGWFKFTTNGKKKVKLQITTAGQGSFRVDVKGKNTKILEFVGANESGTLTLFTKRYSSGGVKKIPLKAGTYYVKISKSWDKTNGAFAIKWK